MTPALLEHLALSRSFVVESFVPLGSWCVNLHVTRKIYSDTLGSLLRQQIGAFPPRRVRSEHVDVELFMVDAESASVVFPAESTVGDDGALAEWQILGEAVRSLWTGWMRLVLLPHRRPHRILLFIRDPQYSERAFRDHLFTLLCKILFVYDRFYLHAGAVQYAGGVQVFVGAGSHGKSTVCLRLAREGATILSEDHVVLRRADGDFLVSGCQDTARVTAKTESWLFPHPLNLSAVDGPGGPKKEFPLAWFFAAAPYRDFHFQRLFFNRVGQRFHIQPLARRDAVLRLIYMTRGFYRHNQHADLEAYLSFFSDLVARRACYDLELSPDLSTLTQLVQFLQTP